MKVKLKLQRNRRNNVFIRKQTWKKIPHIRHLEVYKKEKRYDWCSEYQKIAWKVRVTFLAVIKTEIRCAMVDEFLTSNYSKR